METSCLFESVTWLSLHVVMSDSASVSYADDVMNACACSWCKQRGRLVAQCESVVARWRLGSLIHHVFEVLRQGRKKQGLEAVGNPDVVGLTRQKDRRKGRRRYCGSERWLG